MKSFKKAFSIFKLLSVVMAVIIVLTGCTGKQGEQGEKGERGPQGVAGKDGKTPTITINAEGYWVINGEVTSFKATGTDGKNGVNGKDGKDGQTPAITINEEGYWVINGTVTNVKATGENGTNGVNGTDGKDGETPVITINKDGYWVINGKVTEFKATGTDGKNGENGQTPTITINEEGYWVINGVVTEYKAVPTAITEGDGQTFHMFAPSTLSFRSNAPLSEFQEVQVNGETVDPSNYTLTEGSTIVTFNIDYLKTLDVKKHEVTIVSDSGSPSANFEVIEPELNEHGFYYNQPYTGYVSMFGITYTFFFREAGKMDLMVLDDGYTEVASYTFENDILTVIAEGGVFTATVSETEIYCNELATTFKLGDELIVADEDYIYVYKEDLGGYEVNTIDKTKDKYIDIKSDINGKQIVSIMQGSFENNTNLVVAPKIPESIIEINEYAFSGCTSLTKIILPKSVTFIGYAAFEDCTSLTSITIPESVVHIGVNAFDGSGLTSIKVDENNKVFDSRNNSNSIIHTETNRLRVGCKNTIIPESVTSIGDYAFAGRTDLISITIPKSVIDIGISAFSRCENLSTINYKGTKENWDAVFKSNYWDSNTPSDKVINYNYEG